MLRIIWNFNHLNYVDIIFTNKEKFLLRIDHIIVFVTLQMFQTLQKMFLKV